MALPEAWWLGLLDDVMVHDRFGVCRRLETR